MRKTLLVVLSIALLLSPAAFAQLLETARLGRIEAANPASTTNCTGGVVYDDGVLDDGVSAGGTDSFVVMQFDLPAGTTGLEQVCIAFGRTAAGAASMSFDVVVYDNDGPGGVPGTLLGTVAATATGIPIFPTVQFYNVNLAAAGIVLPDTSVFIGARWPGSSNRFLGTDFTPTTTQRRMYAASDLSATWSNLVTSFPVTPPRALGVRVDAVTPAATCTPSMTAMCLNANRFRVEATYAVGGASAPLGAGEAPALVHSATAVKMTDDTGYLWFFNAANVEAVIKVLDACGVNNRYWVFAGGLTDVNVVITITDTKTGFAKSYSNPQGTPFQPLQRTNDFATCP